MDKDKLYTPDEIAQKLKITKGTVYEMIKRGDLDAHRIGKHLRISDNQFELFLLKYKGAENVYDATIVRNENETIARIGQVGISVHTELEGCVKVSVRPEDIILSKGTFLSSARNVHRGIVTNILIDGSCANVVIDIGIPIAALITQKSLNEMRIETGTELYAVFKTMAVKVYK